MTHAIWRFLTSLRLTVVCLSLAIVLVWVGTVAQADEGLYHAQLRYFKQWWVWGATLWGHRLPLLLPGGHLIGTVLLVNLLAAHIRRFQWSIKKVGIHLTHIGIVVMMLGVFASDMVQVENRMRLTEGGTAGHLESHRASELIVATDAAEAGQEQIVAVPEALVAKGGELVHSALPFAVRVKEYHLNGDIRARGPAIDAGKPAPSTQGTGAEVMASPLPEVKDMDSVNLPYAVLELVEQGKSLGTWLVSPLLKSQDITVGGKTWRLSMRNERTYLPFTFTLLKATHKKYAGSDLPKDFRSRVRIDNAQSGEHREVDIFMNNPLRYGGLAFFQYQMTKDELDRAPGSSVLQVVRNPSWVAPYIGCILVGIGMLWQFGYHLAAFVTKRRAV